MNPTFPFIARAVHKVMSCGRSSGIPWSSWRTSGVTSAAWCRLGRLLHGGHLAHLVSHITGTVGGGFDSLWWLSPACLAQGQSAHRPLPNKAVRDITQSDGVPEDPFRVTGEVRSPRKWRLGESGRCEVLVRPQRQVTTFDPLCPDSNSPYPPHKILDGSRRVAHAV